ncbi:MAG: GNAT family N-acetyltransferase [Candidatus Ratteibacteria bacterium]
MKKKEVTISQADPTQELKDLDTLLWQVLWKPLSLPRNIGEEFRLTRDSIQFIAKQEKKLIGGLVAYYISLKEIEIRHIAVLPKFQRKGTGNELVHTLLSFASKKECTRVYTIARNTSVDFFSKLGFKINPQQKPPDHPSFIQQGITFYYMEIDL